MGLFFRTGKVFFCQDVLVSLVLPWVATHHCNKGQRNDHAVASGSARGPCGQSPSWSFVAAHSFENDGADVQQSAL